MIKLFQLADGGKKYEHTFETTIFPDKTSQIWKINPAPKNGEEYLIEWKFQDESEIFHLLQLSDLLMTLTSLRPKLYVQTLPYARQDKHVSNESTFALSVFLRVINRSFSKILTVDIHSSPPPTAYFYDIENLIPNDRIRDVLRESDSDLVCFPDKGAANRGYQYDEEWLGAPVVLDKDRDQVTGEIRGLKFATKFNPTLTGYKICILDDLTDGGGTFIAAAKLLKAQGASKVFLYTTHGIYSKGTQILFENGLDRIFNYTSEIKNE